MQITKKIIGIVFAGSLLIVSCKPEENNPETVFDSSLILKNCAEGIITQTYLDLNTTAEILLASIVTLESDPSPLNLENARQAWRDCRKPWEQSEGFLFGPVATKGIDPSIDSWPVNTIDLESVLSSTDVLSKTFIDGLEGTLKGFHTIEFLLWGADGNKILDDFTTREFEYMNSLCSSLQGETETLWLSWDNSGENFSINISEAGESTSIYPSQKSGMQELINGMIGIADEVANGKINDPFSTGDISLEESRFSSNSIADFADNIRSIQNIYTGNYNGNEGDGIIEFISNFDTSLAAELEIDIQSAIDALESIPGTFTTAIFDAPDAVSNAQDKILDIKTHLENEVLPLLDEL